MSETQASTAVAGEQNNEQAPDGAKAFEAITSQADFDAAIQSRIARERAKIPTDYDDLKAKASEFEKWQESQKSEAQKVTDRAEAAERRVLELESRTIRAEVSAAKGIPVELLSGSTQEELEKSADALIAFRGEQVATRLTAPREGISPTKQVSDSTEFVKSLFGRGD